MRVFFYYYIIYLEGLFFHSLSLCVCACVRACVCVCVCVCAPNIIVLSVLFTFFKMFVTTFSGEQAGHIMGMGCGNS